MIFFHIRGTRGILRLFEIPFSQSMSFFDSRQVTSIKTKKRYNNIFSKATRHILLIFLRCYDGFPGYMLLYTYYLKFLGVNVIGKPKYIAADLWIDSSDYSLITIGNNVVISKNVYLLTHDYAITKCFVDRNRKSSDIRLLLPIYISDNVFIGLRSTILPGVKIGVNSIIGACSNVTSEVPANMVYAGNPAKLIKSLHDYCLSKLADNKDSKNLFSE